MEYWTACCKSREEENVSLLLQQYQYRREQVVFACVCGDRESDGRAGGYMTKKCLTWFGGLNLKKLLKDREGGIERLSEELIKIIYKTDQEMEEGRIAAGKKTSFGAVFCAEDIYSMLYRGAAGIYLLNTAFGRPYLRRLEGMNVLQEEIYETGSRPMSHGQYQDTDIQEEIYEGRGTLQPDIGLLIATEGFRGGLTEDMIKESLFIREIVSEKQMEKRLEELWKESARRGSTGIGAVLIRTREE